MPRSWSVGYYLVTRCIFKLSTDTDYGQLVIQDIIPAIAALRQSYRMTFSSMLSEVLLIKLGILPTIEIGDLEESDRLFDNLTFK